MSEVSLLPAAGVLFFAMNPTFGLKPSTRG